MQRVRAGLTGLAAIFLMVLIAAAGLRPARPVAHAAGRSETLAVLGVAPGSNGEADRKLAVEPVPPRRVTIRKPVTS